MVLVTTYDNRISYLAERVEGEHETEHTTLIQQAHAEYVHPDPLGIKTLQQNSTGVIEPTFIEGIFAENATITEALNVFDHGELYVQPDEDKDSLVFIGEDNGNLGIQLQNHNMEVIELSWNKGIHAPLSKLSIKEVDCTHNLSANTLYADDHVNAPTVRTNKLVTTLGMNHINLESNLLSTSLIECKTLLAEKIDHLNRSHDGSDIHLNSLSVSDHSMYVGSTRYSHDRVTQKPLVHVLKTRDRYNKVVIIPKG